MTPEEIFKKYRDTHDDKAYEQLQNIEKLDINYKEQNDLEILKETPNLRKLAIRNCKIDDLSIAQGDGALCSLPLSAKSACIYPQD